MKFNGDKFLENLKPYEVKDREEIIHKSSGFLKVVEHICLRSLTADVDFNKFSIKDAMKAFDELEGIPAKWDDSGEYFRCDPTNAYMMTNALADVAWELSNSANKTFSLDKDDLFL